MNTKLPKLSIITINKNNKIGLKKTIDSVLLDQKFNDYEFIIIDGGSNDGSLKIINEIRQALTYWVSERDNGIFHAMNKGIKVAKGEYLLFLNSGDWLIPYILDKVFELSFDKDIIYGDLLLVSNKDSKVHKHLPDKLSVQFFLNDSLPHQATFIKRAIFEKRLYSEKYKIASDWELFLLSIVFDNCSYLHLPFPVTFFDMNGISNTNISLSQEERANVINSLPLLLGENIKRIDYLERVYVNQPLGELMPQLENRIRFQQITSYIIRILFKVYSFFR